MVRGAWVAQLGLGSGYDLMDCGIDPHGRLYTHWGVCWIYSLSPSFFLLLPLPPLVTASKKKKGKKAGSTVKFPKHSTLEQYERKCLSEVLKIIKY